MKLGIKTTDGVAKLKTKTTDGVTKAVECACCKCNPYALWGPGYDDMPDSVYVWGQWLQRYAICGYRMRGIVKNFSNTTPVIWTGGSMTGILLASASIGYSNEGGGWMHFSNFPSSQYTSISQQPSYFSSMISASYRRQEVSEVTPRPAFPYGIWELVDATGDERYAVPPPTLTISPPP